MIEKDRGKEFYNINFQNLLKLKNINDYSRFTDRGPSVAVRVNKTIRIGNQYLKKEIQIG